MVKYVGLGKKLPPLGGRAKVVSHPQNLERLVASGEVWASIEEPASANLHPARGDPGEKLQFFSALESLSVRSSVSGQTQ